MQGKVCVITGGNSGIGLAAAERLGALGARLVLVGRERSRGEAALALLRRRVRGLAARILYADLTRLDGMRRAADDIAALEPSIHVLVNNAGAMFDRRAVTADGLERTFALNHLAYFVLANRLRDRLAAAAPARIVNVASEAHRGYTIDFADLQSERAYRGFAAYGRSKLMNILFTRELARRLAGSGITANCLHPGFVASRFGDDNGALMRIGIGIAKLFAISPQKGAETIVYLASSPDVAGTTGGYFAKSRPAAPTAAAQDDAAARRLWEESERLSGMHG